MFCVYSADTVFRTRSYASGIRSKRCTAVTGHKYCIRVSSAIPSSRKLDGRVT
jgi:hypothetical protein